MIYGYARVSTKTQIKGNSMEEQIVRLTEAGAQEIIQEQHSGKTTDRPLFNELIEKLQPGDTLICTKLDRFARSVEEGTRLLRELLERGIHINILNVGVIDATPIGKFMINTLLAVAELERSMILERMNAGKEIAKTKAGYREGRPPADSKRVAHAVELITKQSYTYRQAAEATGLCVATIHKAVHEKYVTA